MRTHPVYELLEEIGSGTSATVYRAYDQSLKRYVAVKELQDKYLRDPRQMDQFWQEAQFLANLNHDNIVQIHGVDKERGWIIMELMEGSLDAKLGEGALSADLVRSVLQQTLQALQVLHKQNKLHGAIKPANLLINAQGRVKLSDSAGIALGKEIRKPVGSSKYLAPELLNPVFGEVTPALDFYGLGFTALELLKGLEFNALFKGVGPDAIDPELAWMRWHSSTSEVLPPVRELMPKLPPDLAQVIDKLLAKNVADRYQNVDQALRDLEDRPLLLVEPPKTMVRKPGPAKPAGPNVVAVGQKPPAPPPPLKLPSKPQPGPAGAGKKPGQKGGAVHKPWSKEWINVQLKKPAVLYPLLALILLPALLFVLFYDNSGGNSNNKKDAAAGGKTGSLRLKTTPAGATVFFNGKKQDQPTNAKYALAPGKYKVRLELEGYKSHEKDLEIKEGDTRGFDVPLARLEDRTVIVKTVPDEATLEVDGTKQKQKTPTQLKLKAGTYKLVLTREGYEPLHKQLKVELGSSSQTVEYPLTAIPPPPTTTIVVNSTPIGADIYIDGKLETKKTNATFVLPAGPHEVKVVLNGKEFNQTTDPQTKQTTIDLVPITVKTNVPGTKVVVGGVTLKEQADGKYLVQAGKQKIKLEAGDKYRPIEDTITVKAGDKNEFPFKFEPIRKTITVVVNSYPEGALIYVDGVLQKEKTNTSLELSPEPHNIKVVLNGKEFSTTTDPNKQTTIDLVPITVKTDVPGVKVVVGGVTLKEQADGKYLVQVGKQEIKLDAGSKYHPIKDFITVKADGANVFPFKFVPIKKTITIVVNSNPQGALIYVDNVLQKEKTNTTLELSPEPHDIKVVLDGKTFNSKVTGKDDQKTITLEPVTFAINVPGAKVYVDDQLQKTPTDGKYWLAAGTHKVKVMADEKYKLRETDVTVKTGDKNEFRFELELIQRTLVVDSEPARAAVFFDGDKTAKGTTKGDFKLTPGKHQVKVVLDGYEEFTQAVTVAANQDPAAVIAKLVPLKQRQYALLVGVHQPTPQLPDFLHAENDVLALGRTLAIGGYDEVVVLTQSHGRVSLTPGAKGRLNVATDVAATPTSQRIEQELAQLLKKTTAADALVLVLEGHIVQPKGDAADYFCPEAANLNAKATLLSVPDVLGRLQKTPLRNRVVFLDGWRRSWHKADQGAEPPANRRQQDFPADVVVVNSCPVGEKGYDHKDERHGVFLYFVNVGLQGAADDRGDGTVTTAELVDFLRKQVPEHTETACGKRQLPEAQGPAKMQQLPLLKPTLPLRKYQQAGRELELYLRPGKQGSLEKATTLLDQALAAEPDFADAYLRRSEVYFFQSQAHPDKTDDFLQKAVTDCTTVLNKDPKNAMVQSHLAELYRARKQLDKAIEGHQEAIKLEPAYAIEYVLMGEVRFAQKNFSQAGDEFNRALERHPKLVRAYVDRGMTYMEREKYDQARDDFTQAIDLRKEKPSSVLFNNRGTAYVKLKRWEEAIKDFEEATRLKPNFSRAWSNLGTVYAEQKETEKALAAFKEALKITPNFVHALQNRGILYHNNKQYKEAEADFKRALTVEPRNALLWSNLGVVHTATKNTKEAEVCFQKALDVKPDLVHALKNRGILYFNTSRFKEAVDDFERALQVGGENEEIRTYLQNSQKRLSAHK